MTVEDRRGSIGNEGGPTGDRFPAGMRVLAVDDDPICLKVLETLLRCCQYHVTTTGQAITALKMLRENKDEFDLVISDVHMPDMDGFKLLELVGLEMNLPVIMLSANGETEAVMKGITHGACDYLLKPVRIEELRNIWQHVIRRRKPDSRDHSSFHSGEDCEKAQSANAAQGPVTSGVSDQNGKVNMKRKDQNEEDDDCDEITHENDGASTQKRQRVVWTVELHHKFVAAVNQLGLENAVPKKLLDIMNVEGLTRENVASHLQKYRLFLKKISAMASQQANMVAAFRGRHPSYLPIDALEGFRNVHSLTRSRQLPTLASFQPNGMLGRVNNSTGFGQHGFVPSGTVQHVRVHNNTSNCINDLQKLQGIGQLGNANGNLLQGRPMSRELDQMQQYQTVQEANNRFPAVFSGTGLAIGSSSKSFSNVTNNPLLIPANQQQTQSGILGSHSSVRIPSLSSDPFKIGLGDSSYLPDLGRCNDTWQGVVPSNNYPANVSPMVAPSSQNNIPSGNILDNITPIIPHMNSDLHEAHSSSVAVAPLCDSLIESHAQCQASSLGRSTMLMQTGLDENSQLHNSRQKWDRQSQNQSHNPNLIFSSSPSLPNLDVTDTIAENPTLNNGPQKLQDGFSSNACSFDDLINDLIKVERDDLAFFDGDLVNDIFSLGTRM